MWAHCDHLLKPIMPIKAFDDIMKVRIPSSLKVRLANVARRRLTSVGQLIRDQMLAYLALNEAAPQQPPDHPENGKAEAPKAKP